MERKRSAEEVEKCSSLLTLLSVLQDYDYSPSREEHVEDAEGEEDFKSVQDDLELRHAEGKSSPHPLRRSLNTRTPSPKVGPAFASGNHMF